MREARSRAARLGTFAGGLVIAFQVVVLAVRARDVVLVMASNADLSTPLVMASKAASYPGSELVTGHYAWFNGLWPAQVLAKLPAYTTTSNYAPLALTLVASLAVGVVAARLWGALAGVVAVIVLLATGADVLATAAAWSSRAPTWWAMVALAVTAVWAARAPRGRARVAWVVVAVLACLWAAVGIAHDQLAWVVTVGPLAAAALAALLSRAWRLAGTLAVLTATVVLGRFAVVALAEAGGYRYSPEPGQDAIQPFGALGGGVANAFYGVQSLWRAAGTGDLVVLAAYLGTLLAVLATAGGIAGLVRLWAASPDGGAASDATVARRVWVAFWLAVVVLAVGAFAAGTASGPLGGPVTRYLYMLPFAVAALLAAAVGTRTLHPAVVLVPVLALGAINGVATLRAVPAEAPSLHRASISTIRAAVARYDLDRGYASYWTAAPMEHATGYALDLSPVGGCPDDGSGRYRLCRLGLHYIDREFRPRPGIRSFLLVDRSPVAVAGFGPAYVTLPPAGVTPERVVDVGDGVQLYVYPFDLARAVTAPA